MQHFVTGVEKNTRLICWFMFLLRYPLEFMGLYETIWTLFGIKVEGIAIFGNGPNRADQAHENPLRRFWDNVRNSILTLITLAGTPFDFLTFWKSFHKPLNFSITYPNFINLLQQEMPQKCVTDRRQTDRRQTDRQTDWIKC